MSHMFSDHCHSAVRLHDYANKTDRYSGGRTSATLNSCRRSAVALFLLLQCAQESGDLFNLIGG
jgi:hypothetical protein